MKKKIVFMITTMDVGGVEKSLLSLLSVMPEDKYDVTVLFLDRQGDFLDAIPDWVKIQEVSWYKKVWTDIITPPRDTLHGYLKDKKYIKAFLFGLHYFLSRELDNRYIYYRHIFKHVPNNSDQYDIAIAFQGPTDMIDYYIAYKVKARKKISWVHFDVSKHYINTNLYERLYKNFDRIFVVSNEAKKQLVARIPGIVHKTDVFKNIVSESLIHELAREDISFDENYRGLRIVTVGRLSIEKGQDMAIRVLARLRNEGYEARWYCIGEGPQRRKYETLIDDDGLTDDFILLGAKLNPYPYIADSDIYVQPSRHEGYCLALAEARCLKKPIITTNFVGAHEQIINGENGWIVNATEEELYRKIIFLMENPQQQDRLRMNLSKTEIDTSAEVGKLIDYIKV